jgi:hypothetical protein
MTATTYNRNYKREVIMTRKILAEERELRMFTRVATQDLGDWPMVCRLITKLVRAVRADERERCAKAGKNEAFDVLRGQYGVGTAEAVSQCVSAAIRKGKEGG